MNERFEPDLVWFIRGFDVYDREETKGVKLGACDPNDPIERKFIIRNYCFEIPCLSYRHKWELFECLGRALEGSSFDFQSLFDIDDHETNSWPRGEWYSLNDPRCFFETVYKLAREAWNEELMKAAAEDKSTW